MRVEFLLIILFCGQQNNGAMHDPQYRVSHQSVVRSPQSTVRSPHSPVNSPCIVPTDNESYASITLHDPTIDLIIGTSDFFRCTCKQNNNFYRPL